MVRTVTTFGEAGEPWGERIGIPKIIVQPAVGQLHGIRHKIDGILHGGRGLDKSTHIICGIPKTIIDQNGGSANQGDFCGHPFFIQLAVLLGHGFQAVINV